MAEKEFYRRAIRVGNSAGILIPRKFLGADVKAVIINPPRNIKKDSMDILEPFLEEILGVYLITKAEKKAEVLAISTNINKHLEKGFYKINIVPLHIIKKSIAEKDSVKEIIKKAETIINPKLLAELRKNI